MVDKIRYGRISVALKPFKLGSKGAECLDDVWTLEIRVLDVIERTPMVRSAEVYNRAKASQQWTRRALHRLQARGAIDVWSGKNPDGNARVLYFKIVEGWTVGRLQALQVSPSRRGRPSKFNIVSQALCGEPLSIEQVAEKCGVSYATARRCLLKLRDAGGVVIVGEHPVNMAGRNTGRYKAVASVDICV